MNLDSVHGSVHGSAHGSVHGSIHGSVHGFVHGSRSTLTLDSPFGTDFDWI